ncbi:MAG TPA: hypothetical protein VOA41_22140 [Candidatus Dormibacteraeota bacterium]|nr:hypothetical protein [Candidatus Dormibacteraeota bacterium]
MALLLTAFAQFGVYYWRAIMVGLAAEPVSAALAAAGLPPSAVDGSVFPTLVGMHKLTPCLSEGSGGRRGGLLPVSVYFHFVHSLARTVGLRFPRVAAWTQREMTLCARYAAVLVARRLKSNPWHAPPPSAPASPAPGHWL